MSDLKPEQRLQEVDEELPQQPAAVGAEAGRVPKHLTAFRHRNYRLFFCGQLISLTGTWLQQVAQSWLVLELVSRSHAGLAVGAVSAFSAAPVLAFSFYAGIVADRVNKRNLIVITQTIMMILAFVLAALTHWHFVTVYHVAIIGFLLGTALAFDAPTRQSFIVDMVGREDLPNAIALNSAMFNGARILGPSTAGIVIGVIGLAGAFFVNGLSFIAVIIGLLMMRVNPTAPKVGGNAWVEFKEGLKFIRGQRMIRSLLILTGIVSIFGTSYAILMPIFAKYELHLLANGLGYMFTAVGVGALGGALTLSMLGNFSWKGKMLLVGNLVFCIGLILFPFSRNIYTAIPFLLLVGWGMIIQMALTNTMIQMTVPDQLRGRVISVYTFMFIGMTPIGSMIAGVFEHTFGVSTTVRIGAVVCSLAGLILAPRFIKGNTRADG